LHADGAGNVFCWDAHTFIVVHGGIAEVKVLDIGCHGMCIFGGDGTVQEDFTVVKLVV
jgi:hypothetical protein